MSRLRARPEELINAITIFIINHMNIHKFWCSTCSLAVLLENSVSVFGTGIFGLRLIDSYQGQN
jgi:hypothetical protein